MIRLSRFSALLFRGRYSTIASKMRFIDIGANLTDDMFRGQYNGSQKHPDDYERVLDRAWVAGLDKIIITVGTMNEVDSAMRLAQQHDRLYITAGCHPTRCNDFLADPDGYYSRIDAYIASNREKVVAIGECGLDYDRLKFCPVDVQREYFEKQLDLVATHRLPLFLHCRNAFDDFWNIVQRNADKIQASGGVVHSFDGTLEQAQKFIDFGFYIGINGCSLKTQEQLDTVAKLPLDRLMLETDAPWCGIRPSHAGSKFVKTKFDVVKKKEKWTETAMVDGRNEPAQIRQVLEVLAAIFDKDEQQLAEQFYQNTMSLFFTNQSIKCITDQKCNEMNTIE